MGGIRSTRGDEVYSFGIIDFLQKYNMKKKMAHAAKSKTAPANQLSTVPAQEYADRFGLFVISLLD